MKADFSRIISLLRRENNLSQKQASVDLGISQALLSHYEKGIRECGLEFVVKVADYYGVSCDYLLGRSADRSGLMMTADELPDPNIKGKELAIGQSALIPMLSKKLVLNSANILYDLLAKMKCRELTKEVSMFLMLAIYRMFRVVYSVEPKNPQGLFSCPKVLYRGYSSSEMLNAEARAIAMSEGAKWDYSYDEIRKIELDSVKISESYPLFASSLMNLIKNSEETMLKPHEKSKLK